MYPDPDVPRPAAKIHQKHRTGPPRLQHHYQPGQLDGLPRIDNRTTNGTAPHNTANRLRRQTEHVHCSVTQHYFVAYLQRQTQKLNK